MPNYHQIRRPGFFYGGMAGARSNPLRKGERNEHEEATEESGYRRCDRCAGPGGDRRGIKRGGRGRYQHPQRAGAGRHSRSPAARRTARLWWRGKPSSSGRKTGIMTTGSTRVSTRSIRRGRSTRTSHLDGLRPGCGPPRLGFAGVRRVCFLQDGRNVGRGDQGQEDIDQFRVERFPRLRPEDLYGLFG